MSKLRCAIYTRKSSEEGLDQTFNSLDAQREACEAYIASQKGEGWTALRSLYDDGGWSGGSMDRPGLKRLLDDIAAGKVDIVVVYKVDRLTRSLSDFARMVDLFDKHNVSFVSVTQAFNTTSSMGRLTLNVLLSFAQFEREVTGERIRDKIAASKARGMWMGGYPPLGYYPKERTLAVNQAEAEIVRHIFTRYVELGSVNQLALELEQQGVVSKRWTSASGVARGGVPLSRGALFHMLRNRLYLGEIVHKAISHPGQYDAILDEELFAAVRVRLDANRVLRRERTIRNSPLTGLVFDTAGNRMSPAHAHGKSGQRYLYYVSTPLQSGGTVRDDILCRVPASVIEDAVFERLRRWSDRSPAGLGDLASFLRRVEVRRDRIVVDVAPPAHEDWLANLGPEEQASPVSDDTMRVACSLKISTRGGRTWLIQSGAAAPRKARPDRALIAGLRRSHAELKSRGIDLSNSRAPIPDAKGMGDPYLRKLSSIAFLAPDIQRAILEGRQPTGLTLGNLLAGPLPLDWQKQRDMLGFAGPRYPNRA
jgi:DNA invertase Pin-like site-specific DNA recombinase